MTNHIHLLLEPTKDSENLTYLMKLISQRYGQPVRAGIVEKPDDYKFSSYRTKVGKKELKLLDHDPAYIALGKTDDERQTAYRRWFQDSIPKAEWEPVR